MENKNTNWDLIKKDYIKLKGKVNLKEFAEKHGVKYSTLRSRKNRENWDNELKTVARSNASKKRDVASKKDEANKSVKELNKNSALNDRQKLFCIYYVKYFNSTKAAIKAGYSKETAGQIGYQLLQKTSIKEEITNLKGNKLKGAFLEAGDILQKYIDIAFSDTKDFIEYGKKEKVIGISDKGELVKVEDNFLDLKNDYESDGTLIKEIKVSKQGISIKLEDRIKALEWLSNFFEMNPEHKFKKIFDEKKLQLSRDRFDHDKDIDSKKYW